MLTDIKIMILFLIQLYYVVGDATNIPRNSGGTIASPDILSPDMLANHNRWITTQYNQVFPSTIGGFTYATMCGYQVLSLKEMEPNECVVMAVSLLLTSPKYGMVFLIPKTAVIEEGFQKIVSALNIQVHRYDMISLPEYGLNRHKTNGATNWIIAYQKLNMLNLVDYKKILFLDTDQIVNRNIDHIFDSPSDMMGNDCLPHQGSHRYADHRQFFIDAYISSIVLVVPSAAKFKTALKLLSEGTITNPSGAPVGWKYDGGDQDLLIHVLHNLTLLDCVYLSFPEICTISAHPLIAYPPSKFYVFHYTYGPRGTKLSNEFYRGSRMIKKKHEYGWNNDVYNHQMECMQIFAFSFEHYFNLTKVILHHILHHGKEALPISKLLKHPSVSFSNWIELKYDKNQINYNPPDDSASKKMNYTALRTECIQMKSKYDVKPQLSWGALPIDLQRRWNQISCGYVLKLRLS